MDLFEKKEQNDAQAPDEGACLCELLEACVDRETPDPEKVRRKMAELKGETEK